MTARPIDGKALAARVREGIVVRAAAVAARGGRVGLDAVLVESGDNGARVYADNQARTCAELGIEYRLHLLPASAGFDDIAGRVMLLSADEKVTAVMVHMPLPEGVDPYRVQRLIAPEKDVEGVNPANIGNVVYGRSSLAPCTGLAVVRMVESVFMEEGGGVPGVMSGGVGGGGMLRGKVAVVVGASDVVGKPIAVLLMRREATVVSCNRWTPDLAGLTRTGDVLVSAVGKPGLITGGMVKPGAVVIDVGVNRVTDASGVTRTVGDVDFAGVSGVASRVSPVPGGVGPVTVAMLLVNVLEAAEKRYGLHG
ncbi:MAG: bifunctional 5,10-methylenetetrahydrofolate dehydrogenase/5,10-methenyltetrahydrofolate cyclohydrolase [Phycisphaeraceae bacterium]|nr:MAG: bifunctional 5,10-methylenetetrahydrofolate dehydrogenase/5,10-methenyltetrahydrofolate cyclohydrolase [Phycisphaeraceae bacterium]